MMGSYGKFEFTVHAQCYYLAAKVAFMSFVVQSRIKWYPTTTHQRLQMWLYREAHGNMVSAQRRHLAV